MLRLPGIALALASLGFLGLGASPPAPEWGRVIAEGMPYLERAYWVVLAPAVALAVLSVMGVSLAGLTGQKNKYFSIRCCHHDGNVEQLRRRYFVEKVGQRFF